jgi:hypothetical protein
MHEQIIYDVRMAMNVAAVWWWNGGINGKKKIKNNV